MADIENGHGALRLPRLNSASMRTLPLPAPAFFLYLIGR
jgi:hypothetical protein